MHAKIVTFAAGALFVLGNAVPLNNKRDIVWVTEVDTAIETIPVTTTVWVDPTPAAEQPKHYAHGHRNKHQHEQEQSAKPTVEVQPTPSSEPSSAVQPAAPSAPAPAPSSYEAPAAPSPTEEPATSAAPSSSEVAPVQQQPTSTLEPQTTQAPSTPASTYQAPATTSAAPAPSSYDSSSSGSSSSNPAAGESFTGELTYFTPGMGACGETSGENDAMVAIAQSLFDKYTPGGNPNKNPLCGQSVTIKGADGSEHSAKIWDRCVGCAESDLDMPQAFFNKVTTPKGSNTPADGRAYGYEWSIN